ncbi:MAG: FecR domain-containing protein [Bacteroidota bacterium]
MEKKYTQYTVIDFAEDPEFIRWVRGDNPKATAFWEEWVGNHPEKTTLVDEAKQLVKAIRFREEEPTEAQVKNLWAKIDAATAVAPPTAVVRSINRRRWIGLAAAACIGLIAFFVFYNPTTTVSVSKGAHLVQTLPDDSKVELNADSKITFSKRNFADNRTVHLEGEAFFEVEKGTTFKVVTPQGTVEVLGTSFNVNTRDGQFIVDCRSGKVRVSAKGSSQVLTRNQGTQLATEENKLSTVYPVDIVKKTGWKTGTYNLENVPFEKALAELERQYDVTVKVDAALKNRIGDYTFKGDNLKMAVSDLVFQLNADFKINRKQVIIKEK